MINKIKSALVVIFALFFVVAGVMHFVKVGSFAAIVPPLLPFPKLIVWVTGLLEIGMGVMLLCPHFRANVGVMLCLFLLAVLPANIYMAMAGIGFDDSVASSGVLWARVGLQFPLIAVVYWCTRDEALTK
jgi:uncharacterized membrane protein